MDYIGVSGLVVSIAGFALSLWQIGKARTAAEAATTAAREAVAAVRAIHAVADIQEICGRSRNLLHLVRAGNIEAAATAAFELRELVARFHATDAAHRLASAETWRQAFDSLCSIHDRFETAAMVKTLHHDERKTSLHEISQLHTQFSTFAAAAADTGVNHDNSH
ncbi:MULTISPECIES: hypothetical protein [unclassified Duganella]|uniref:hypothetical protein n=1 Tax=unclassified Duganella TaxID=2636909 RepID=UPI000E341BC3|nr:MULTISPECIES: hypothetical protein [unclassified Duganella]RFP14761.1 hypothetical protein D0T23_12230 [Duganella sp. BJB475]RFP31110.1 hypothetical protein D0T21_14610 [Duganella sp. BJB476]